MASVFSIFEKKANLENPSTSLWHCIFIHLFIYF